MPWERLKKTIEWLLDNGYIKSVPYEEMTNEQKSYYTSDGYCIIYEKIKDFKE